MPAPRLPKFGLRLLLTMLFLLILTSAMALDSIGRWREAAFTYDLGLTFESSMGMLCLSLSYKDPTPPFSSGPGKDFFRKGFVFTSFPMSRSEPSPFGSTAYPFFLSSRFPLAGYWEYSMTLPYWNLLAIEGIVIAWLLWVRHKRRFLVGSAKPNSKLTGG